MSSSTLRRRSGLLGALALAILAALSPASATPVQASSPSLALVGSAVYTVQPAKHRVVVSVDLTATNRRGETVTTLYVYDHANLAVLPGATSFRATNNGTKVSVTVARRSSASTLLSIRFAKRLRSGRSTRIRLTFLLPDNGGSPSRAVRVGEALASFPVWAFGTHGTPGSSATVRFPAGYSVRVASGALGEPKTAVDGTVSASTGPLSDPWALSAYVVGERPGAYVQIPVSIQLGPQSADLLVRVWADDPGWGKRVIALLRLGLPALHRAIGVGDLPAGQIVVEEATASAMDGTAGTFDPVTQTIRLDFTAPGRVLMLEAAHLWFNGRHFADRWIADGLAAWAADRASASLKLPGKPAALTPPLRAAAVPLNAWIPGAVAELAPPSEAILGASSVSDQYAELAARDVMALVAERSGAEGFRAVLDAALSGQGAYSEPAGAQIAAPSPSGPVDWRGFLDLVSERAGADASDIWRTYVTRPSEALVLGERKSARSDYEELLGDAGDWKVPAAVRSALEAWRFEAAVTRAALLRSVLSANDALAEAATTAHVELLPTVRQHFEANDPEAAFSEIRIERAIVDQIVLADVAGSVRPGFLATVGLLGQDPAGQLASARAAFARGDLATSQSGAIAAWTAWTGAADLGGLRLRAVGAVIILMLLAVALGSARFRRRAIRGATR